MDEHGLRKFRVQTHHGTIFATASAETEPLEDYLGPEILEQFNSIFPGEELRLLAFTATSCPATGSSTRKT